MEELNKNFLWKAYFFNTGFVSLITISSVFSTFQYAEERSGNSNIVPFLTTSYSLGLLTSFFFSEYIFGKLYLIKRLYISTAIIFITFFIWVTTLVLKIGNPTWMTLIGCSMIFIDGIASSYYQSISIGLASCISYDEIKYFNQGNGLAGIITILVTFIIYFIDEGLYLKNTFIYIYSIIVIIYIFIFYYISYLFLNKFETYLSKKLQEKTSDLVNDSELKKEKVNLKSLILTNLDFIMGMILTYATTLTVYPSVLFKINLENVSFGPKYPLVQLIYTIGDYLPRYLPENLVPTKNGYIYTYILSRIILFTAIFYLSYAAIFDNSTVNYIFVVILFFMVSFSNGHLTMSLFGYAPDRFKKKFDKNYAGRLQLFGLFFGIFYGSIICLISIGK